jgi:RNA polymerase sigma-70 factor, ECF subfamily
MGDSASEAPDGEARLVSAMIAYQAGKLDGFTDLYAELASDLERFFVGTAGREVAEDLVQDAFLEIHRSRRTYRAPRPVRPWVFGLAWNVLRRYRRAAWRRRRREEAAGVALARGAEASRRNRPPFDAGDLQEALRRLPVTRREVWILHHQHGWSFPEIAARLAIGVDAAKLRSSRAMRSLRRVLGVAQPPEPAAGCDYKKGDPRG